MSRFQMACERKVRFVLVVLWELLEDGLHFISAIASSRTAVAAEVLFLRKQLAYYQEHQTRPRRLTDVADYKVPEHVIFLPALPKGITGKLQRRALKDLILAGTLPLKATGVSDNAGGVKHFFEHTSPCTPKRAPFRSN